MRQKTNATIFILLSIFFIKCSTSETLCYPNYNDRKIVWYNKKKTKYKVVNYLNHKEPKIRIHDTIRPVGTYLICLDEFR